MNLIITDNKTPKLPFYSVTRKEGGIVTICIKDSKINCKKCILNYNCLVKEKGEMR